MLPNAVLMMSNNAGIYARAFIQLLSIHEKPHERKKGVISPMPLGEDAII